MACEQLVSKDSACLDCHKRIPLEVRHAMMNKFRGPEDTNFRLVSGQLREIAENSRVAQSRTREELNCLQSLTSTYREDKNRCEQRVPGTCTWVLQHPKFLHWRQEDASSLLWISADPGCGKSVLSRCLIDEQLLSLDTKRTSTCYFFFKDDDESRQNGADALCAILHQLFVQKPTLLKYAMPDYGNNGRQLRTMFSTLWEILEKSANDNEAGEIICVLDALDECKDSARVDLIQKLAWLHLHRKRTTMKLKFLATSRPYESIERSFYKFGGDVLNISLRGEDESEKISKEIDMVIDVQLPRICQNRRFPLKHDVQQALIHRLKTIQNRTYLWLHLIYDVIETSLDSSKARLERLVQNIPATVDEAYEKLLMRNTNPEKAARARRLLHIVIAAVRPLTLHEMNIAVAIDEKLQDKEYVDTYEDLDLDNDLPFKTKIRNICGLFIGIHDSRVFLIHQTARDFLASKSSSTTFYSFGTPATGHWKHSLNPVDSNYVLVKICLSYLLFSDLDSSEHTADIASFLAYTAENWFTHFQKAKIGMEDDILKSTFRVCDTQSDTFQRWFSLYWKGICYDAPAADSLTIASYFGLETIVKLLLSMKDVELNCVNCDNRTPLSWAVSEGHIEVVKQLLEKDGVDLNSKDNHDRTPLSWAVEMNHTQILSMLLDKDEIDINVKTKSGWTPFGRAINKRQVETVKLMLRKDSLDLNSHNKQDGETPLMIAIMGENCVERIQIITLLLGQKKIDVNQRNYADHTPLYYAASTNYIKVINLLLERADIDIRSYNKMMDETALSVAVLKGFSTVAQSILEKTNLDIMPSSDVARVLSIAVENGQNEIVKSMLQIKGINLNHRKNIVSRTILNVAADSPHFQCWELLFQHEGLDLTHKDNNIELLLPRMARWCANTRGVELLLQKGLMITNNKDEFGMTALSWAAKNGHLQIVKLLMQEKSIVLNSKDLTGRTPLSWAAGAGHNQIVELLLKEDKIELNTMDCFSRTPLSLAAEAGHLEVVDLLLNKKDVELNLQYHPGLKLSSWTTHEKILIHKNLNSKSYNVKDFLRCNMPFSTEYEPGAQYLYEIMMGNGAPWRPEFWLYANWAADSEFTIHDNQTPMSCAAREGHQNVVKSFLRKNGVDLNAVDCHGRTSLSWAAEQGHQEVVKMLLENPNVELNLKDSQFGFSPLAWSVREIKTNVVELLLENVQVDLNSVDHHGRTPLSWAAEVGSSTIVELLPQRNDVELNFKDFDDELTPLGWAARKGQINVIKILLSKDGVDVNVRDKNGQTPFARAARERHIEAIKCFLNEPSVDLNRKDHENLTPLAWAVRKRYGKIIKLLLQKHEIDINTKNHQGRTPLTFAAENGYLEIVRLLLKQTDIEINSRDEHDRTPLSFAAENGHVEIVRLLLKQEGIEIDFPDGHARTPLSWAMENGHDGIIKKLLREKT